MISLPTQAILGAGTAVVAAVATMTVGGLPFAIGLVAAMVVAALAFVAFAAQSERLRDDQRLIYRPVYVRRHDVRRRIGSDD